MDHWNWKQFSQIYTQRSCVPLCTPHICSQHGGPSHITATSSVIYLSKNTFEVRNMLTDNRSLVRIYSAMPTFTVCEQYLSRCHWFLFCILTEWTMGTFVLVCEKKRLTIYLNYKHLNKVLTVLNNFMDLH